jgi:hypothetical protein
VSDRDGGANPTKGSLGLIGSLVPGKGIKLTLRQKKKLSRNINYIHVRIFVRYGAPHRCSSAFAFVRKRLNNQDKSSFICPDAFVGVHFRVLEANKFVGHDVGLPQKAITRRPTKEPAHAANESPD